jgi:heptaprenyl diphosphate synthase
MLIQPSREDQRVAWFAALAISIHIAEAALPSPLPGLKPGLANVVTVVVLVKFGWRIAVWVNILRVIVGSLVVGSFLTPTFMLSLSGAIASLLVLLLLVQLPSNWQCSAIGYSVAAAMAHTLGQFYVAYWLFIQHSGLFYLLPPLMTAAIIFGLLTGIIAAHIVARLESG